MAKGANKTQAVNTYEEQGPRDWTPAKATPFEKKIDKSVAWNNRPISLTSMAGKILEKISKFSELSYPTKNTILEANTLI